MFVNNSVYFNTTANYNQWKQMLNEYLFNIVNQNVKMFVKVYFMSELLYWKVTI